MNQQDIPSFKKDAEIEFTFLVFQNDCRKGKISLWIDGSKIKKVYRTAVFEEVMRNKRPSLHGKIQQVLNTYSFYLVSLESDMVRKLDPSGKDSPYKDSIPMYMTGKVKLPASEESLVDSLWQMGFDPLSEEDIKNFNIRISKRQEPNIISRFMSLIRGKDK